jgi:hypothetical protein
MFFVSLSFTGFVYHISRAKQSKAVTNREPVMQVSELIGSSSKIQAGRARVNPANDDNS